MGVLLLAAISVFPQTGSPRRPRVAVVLSGGGAKGMAHIGVLKVLERAGVPIDIVTGTSMGSIVGGLYASGYDARQLDSIVRAQNWGVLLSDKAEQRRQSLQLREKQNTYFYTKHFMLGKKDIGDMGLVKGNNIMRLFEQLVGSDSIDFATLPAPFACVATDILDNTEYDFHGGSLACAMRASMAIPAAFSPVRIGDHVLVDGGLRNNYPADLARQMGADYVIGVSVQDEAKTADDMSSTASILGQIIDVNCKNKYDENWAMTDVKMRVNVSGYSVLSFTPAAIDTLIRRGEEEAMQHWDELKRLASLASEKEKREMRARRVQAVSSLLPASDDTPATTSRESLASIGVRFDNEERVAMQANLTIPFQTWLPSDLDLTLRLGKRITGRVDYFAHRRSGNQLTTPRSMGRVSYIYHHDEINIYEDGDRAFNFTYNQHAGELSLLDFNIRNLNIDLGARFDFYDFRSLLMSNTVFAPDLDLGDEHFISYHARIGFDSEDNWYFPTRGARFHAQYAYYTDDFGRLDNRPGLSEVSGMWRMSLTLGQRFTLQPMLYGRLLFGTERPVYLSNMIGGEWFAHYTDYQMPFVGIGHTQLTDPHFIAAQLQASQCIARNSHVMLRVAGAQHAPKLKEMGEHGVMWGVQAAYYYYSPFGPIGASFGWSNETQEPSFYVNFGYEF